MFALYRTFNLCVLFFIYFTITREIEWIEWKKNGKPNTERIAYDCIITSLDEHRVTNRLLYILKHSLKHHILQLLYRISQTLSRSLCLSLAGAQNIHNFIASLGPHDNNWLILHHFNQNVYIFTVRKNCNWSLSRCSAVEHWTNGGWSSWLSWSRPPTPPPLLLLVVRWLTGAGVETVWTEFAFDAFVLNVLSS